MVSNKDKILEAVLLNEQLMEFGGYTSNDIGTIYQALDSDNYVINTVAQIIMRTDEEASTSEIWREINVYLRNHV